MRNMRLAIIGLGRAGRVHFDAALATPGVELVAACDPAADARAFAAKSGVKAYERVVELLDGESLDAVTICTPPSGHVACALPFLESGIHVLCEKPLARDPTEAARMFAAADRHRVLLAVASKFRHVPAIERARELVRSGKLGEPVAFDVSFCAATDMSKRWNGVREISGGGVIMDNGSHVFDVAIYLFDGLERVQASILRPLQKIEVEDSAHLRFVAAGAVMGSSSLSWSVCAVDDQYLRVHCSRGSIVVGWKAAQVKADGPADGNGKAGGWRSLGDPYDKALAHRAMYARFRDAVRFGRTLWIRPEECLQISAAVRAAYRSAVSDAWERVIRSGGFGGTRESRQHAA